MKNKLRLETAPFRGLIGLGRGLTPSKLFRLFMDVD
jgi:hypothetical protein